MYHKSSTYLKPKLKEVYHYEVNIPKTTGVYDWEKPYFVSEKIKVLVENATWIIVDTWSLSKLHKDIDKYSSDCLGKPYVSIRTGKSLFDEGVFYSLYSLKEKRASTIRNEINKKISKDYGWLGAVDLSIITDKKEKKNDEEV